MILSKIFQIELSEIAWDWFWLLVGLCAIAVLVIIVALLLTSKRHGSRRIIEYSELQQSQNIEDGYIGVDMSPIKLIGAKGIAITDMRPSGKITVDGADYDAVAVLGFIDDKTPVEVVKYENAQVYVKAINN